PCSSTAAASGGASSRATCPTWTEAACITDGQIQIMVMPDPCDWMCGRRNVRTEDCHEFGRFFVLRGHPGARPHRRKLRMRLRRPFQKRTDPGDPEYGAAPRLDGPSGGRAGHGGFAARERAGV